MSRERRGLATPGEGAVLPQLVQGVLVLIASPGDASEERAVVRDVLTDWNVNRGRREQVALLPWMWERHAVPQVGGRPQAIINSQAVDRADVVVAFFDSRLGTATSVDVSGTAEEINRAVELGRPVHVYFSEEPISRDVDPEQLLALRDFKRELETRGLLGSYVDPQDLAGQVVRAIDADIEERGWGGLTNPSESSAGAILHWEHQHAQQHRGFDSRGGPMYRTTANDLVVRNDGDAPAEDLTFEVAPVGDTEFALPESPRDPFTLQPKSERAWSLIPLPHFGASGRTIEITARWHEGSEEREESRTLTLN